MAQELTNKATPRFSVAIKSEGYQKLINDTLGDKELAREFVANITTVVANNPTLQNCDPKSILSAGLMASSLKLPLSPTLGFAYVVPYGNNAQFQMGYKGLIQLCQRTGLFETIGVRPVHEGEYVGQNEFGEDIFKFSHDCDANPTIGYFAYFKLLSGFKKTLYWTKEQAEAHGRTYSQTYKKFGSGLWKDNFDGMATKTVLKMLISKYAPMSVEIQKAITSDQAIIKEDGSYTYVDNSDFNGDGVVEESSFDVPVFEE